jgi:hypothetical protein
VPPRKRSQSRPSGTPDDATEQGERTDGPDSSAPSGPGGGGGGGEPPQLGRNPDADPVRIHREYVQRRLGGGAPPTPEAYERALDQWHQLGGAVRRPAGEVHPEDAKRREAEQRNLIERRPDTAEQYDGPLPATDPGDNSPYEHGAP